MMPRRHFLAWSRLASVCLLTCSAACSSQTLTAIGGTRDLATGGGGGDGGVGTSGGKRGVAYGFKSTNDLTALGPSVAWWYNWSPQPDPPVRGATTPEFVPMVWGGTFDVATVESQIPAGAKYLLGFNEPNFGSQSNLTPDQAAALWPKVEQIAKDKNLMIVSPALNYCGGSCNETDPFVWLQKFFAACTNCRVDFIALHWYACTKGALENYLGNYKAKFSQPLWLTEFSCLDQATITDAQESTYQHDALDVLESDPIIFRYSWFTGRSTNNPVVSLLAADGVLTALGQSYVTHP